MQFIHLKSNLHGRRSNYEKKIASIIISVCLFSLTSCTTSIKNKFERVDNDFASYDVKVQKMKDEFGQIFVDPKDKKWVKSKLKHMVRVDQYMRKYLSTPYENGYSPVEQKYFKAKFLPKFEKLDSENTGELKKLLAIYEWFFISEFGEKADKNAWLLVQHADLDLDFQNEVLKILTKLYPKNETNRSNYAYLYDRVRSVGEKIPQKYGTQGKCVGLGKWEPNEIEDAINVDKRRKEMGMVSLAVYKTWHCCRHTRGTFLYGKTGDKALSMAWLGHSSERVYNKYLHTYEALMREIKAKDFDWGKLER